MPMTAGPPEPISGGEAVPEENEEKETADVRVREFSEIMLLDKKGRVEAAIKNGLAERLPDGGKKLRAELDAICRELTRGKALKGGTHSHHGGPEARAQDQKGCERVLRSRGAETSGIARDSNNGKIAKDDFLLSFGNDVKAGVGISNLKITRSRGKPNPPVENEGKFFQEKKSSKSSAQLSTSSLEELHVDNSADMEKTSSDDSMKDNGRDQICMPALTPSRKRKGDATVGHSMRLRSRKEEVVLVDVDTPHQDTAEGMPNSWSAGILYYPTREHPNAVEISVDDIKCLEPESLLCSPIMNLYIMYLQGPTFSFGRPRSEYHIFNTYFFSKLEDITLKEDKDAYFLKLRRWWKGVDIFQKAYLLLPVHAEEHWSLVIICMPAKDDKTGPLILHLDSLKFHNSRLIFAVVSSFLKEEWSYLHGNISSTEFPLQETVWKNLPRKIEKKKIEVPQQKNDYDCGLFVLYYMHRFLLDAPERLDKKSLNMFGKDWFGPEEPSKLRREIRNLILSCTEKNDGTQHSLGEAEPKNGTTEPLCGETEHKHDANGEAGPKNGTTEPSCGEAECSHDATGEAEPRNGTMEPLRGEAEHSYDATGEAEPRNGTTEPSLGEAEHNNDATGEGEFKNDATEESCAEAEPKNGKTAGPSSVEEVESKKYATEHHQKSCEVVKKIAGFRKCTFLLKRPVDAMDAAPQHTNSDC